MSARGSTGAKCVFRNPICGHSYERDSLAHLMRDAGATCPMIGCSNDHALHKTDLVYAIEPDMR